MQSLTRTCQKVIQNFFNIVVFRHNEKLNVWQPFKNRLKTLQKV